MHYINNSFVVFYSLNVIPLMSSKVDVVRLF